LSWLKRLQEEFMRRMDQIENDLDSGVSEDTAQEEDDEQRIEGGEEETESEESVIQF